MLKQAAGANPEDSATPRSLLPGLASYSPNPLIAYNVEKLPASGTLKQPPNLRYRTSSIDNLRRLEQSPRTKIWRRQFEKLIKKNL